MDGYTLARYAESELHATDVAHKRLRSDLIDQLIATEPQDTAAREAFYHQIKGLDALRETLKTFVSNDAYEAAARKAVEE